MDVTSTINKQGQNLADKAASKLQGGIQDATRTLNRAGDQLSSKVDDLRSDAKPVIKKLAQSVRTTTNQASASLIAYAKKNPVTAVLIAAAAGTVLATLFHGISRSRD